MLILFFYFLPLIDPTWKSQFYENILLIINKLQRQKIHFSTFSSGLINLSLASKLHTLWTNDYQLDGIENHQPNGIEIRCSKGKGQKL